MDSKKTKILLVDDDDMTRELYAEVFRKTGAYEVLEANDGVEGLDLATKELPDVIFTGIVMPRMDGFALMEALKKTVMTANIPVIISSHMGREEDQRRANQLGAKEFVIRNMTPPIRIVEIVSSLFVNAGREYKIDFNAYNMDAQKLVRDLNMNADYQCLDCGEKLVLNIKLQNVKDKIFEGRFVCPSCGAFVR